MKEIARIADTSVMTVSRALSGSVKCAPSTREKIEKIAAEFGYLPNALGRSLACDRLDMVGVIVPNLVHWFFPLIVSAIEDILSPAGYLTFICCSHDDTDTEARKAANMLSYRPAGVIMLPSLRSEMSAKTARMITDAGCPFVLVDRMIKGFKSDSVSWKSGEAMERIAGDLLARGCSKFAYVCGDLKEWSQRGRTRAFFRALKRGGICKQSVCLIADNGSGSLRNGLIGAFSGKERPDAICCASDIFVDETLGILESIGVRIPRDAALTGFGGVANAHNSKLRITTASQDPFEMGKVAADLLLKRIAQKKSGVDAIPHMEIKLPVNVDFFESSDYFKQKR